MIEQRLSSWMEWKTKCELSLCGADVQRELSRYAWSKGCEWSTKSGLNIRMLVGDRALDLPEARETGEKVVWGYFEHRALAGTHRSGKCYKDWIFSHAEEHGGSAHRLAAVLSGVRLQMQMVIRNVFADEISLDRERKERRRDQSGETEDEESSTNDWLDQCANRADALLAPSLLHGVKPEERGEFDRAGRRLAQDWMDQASRRDKLVLWVALEGGALSNPKVEQAAGVKKSQLSACLAKAKNRFREMIQSNNLPCQEWIGGAMLDRLHQALAAWAKSENLTDPGLFEREG